MPHPPDRGRPPGPGEPGPIEPGSALYRLLEMIAEAVARSPSRTPPAPARRPATGPYSRGIPPGD